MARPSKLTPNVHAKVVAAITAGAYAEIAARHAGIDEATYYRWMARGRTELARLDDIATHLEVLGPRPRTKPKRAERTTLTTERKQLLAEPRYREFCEAVMRASAEAEVEAGEVLRQVGAGWREQCAVCDGTGTVTVREAAKSEAGQAKSSRTKATVRVCGTCEGRGEIVRDPDWRAIAWYLERRHPDRWRRRDSHEHVGPPAEGSETPGPIQIVGGVGDPKLTKAAHDFLRAAREHRRAPVDTGD